jgi:hypothetical protein
LLSETAAAVSVRIINCVGNLGFVGPWLAAGMLSGLFPGSGMMLAASFHRRAVHLLRPANQPSPRWLNM